MNTNAILGALLNSGMSGGRGQRRLDSAVGRSGGLGGMLESMLGGQGAGRSGSGGLGGMLGQLTGGSASGGGTGGMLGQVKDVLKRNPNLAGGGIGALAGAVMGRGQPVGGMLGGLVMGALGMIAANALKTSGDPAEQAAAAAPAGPAPAPAAAAASEAEDLAMPMLKAMIAAAKADGQIDQTELNLILGKLDEGGVDAEGRNWVLREMSTPTDLAGFTALAGNPMAAAEVYAAALLAIRVDTAAEHAFLKQLAQALRLSPGAVAALHAQLEVPADGAPASASGGPTAPTSGITNPWS